MSKLVEAFMASAALASIILISLGDLVKLNAAQLLLVQIADLVIVLVFAAEFAHRLRVEKDRIGFLRGHWYEIFAMLPAILFVRLEAQPSIGAALRSLRAVRLLRLVGMATRFVRLGALTSDIVRRSRMVYLSVITASAIFLSSIAILLMEKDVPGSQISTIWDALWWSINTVSTVALPAGNPLTPQGRVVAAVTIFVGVAFVGIFTSLLVTALVQRRLQGSEPRTLRGSVIEAVIERLARFEALSADEVSTLRRVVETLCDDRLEKLTRASAT